MVTFNNVSYTVGSKILLHSLSVQWAMDKMNLIIGPNGAGKSTLIKLVCKQLKPTTGYIKLGEMDLSAIQIEQLATIRAVLSQNSELAFPLTAKEVVMMGRYPHFKNQPTLNDYKAVEEAMRFFDVWSFTDRNYLTLSGGEKQRVQFARVLAQIWYSSESPRYLVLDEPLTFLDIHYQIQLMKQLKTLLAGGNLMVIGVLHDLNLAARFADSILLLNQGKVIANGLPENVLNKENIKAAFQLDTEIVRSEKTNSMHLLFG
jgi:iron complex transport system ATP-binding protein